MPVVQTNTWVLNDDNVVTDSADFQRARELLKTATGFQGLYSGTADEDPKRYFNFIIWDTLEDHKAYMTHPEFPAISKLVRSTQKSDAKYAHVEFIKDFIPALSAPTTEIVGLTLKDGATKERLYGILDIIAAKVDAGNTKYGPVTYGPTLADPEKFYLIIGWDSMQAHIDYVGNPEFKPVLDDLRSATVLEMFHCSLKKEV